MLFTVEPKKEFVRIKHFLRKKDYFFLNVSQIRTTILNMHWHPLYKDSLEKTSGVGKTQLYPFQQKFGTPVLDRTKSEILT